MVASLEPSPGPGVNNRRPWSVSFVLQRCPRASCTTFITLAIYTIVLNAVSCDPASLRTTGDRLGRNPLVLISHPYVRVSLDLPAPRASLKCPSVRKSMSSISSRIALCAQHSSTHSQSQHGGLTTTFMNHLLKMGASHAYSAENRRNRPIRHCHQWREGTAGQRFSRCDVVWLRDTQS